jgi:PIN domain nuclease of toxin-antitoxin system
VSEATGQLVLDASALLAYLGNETGADVVSDAIAGGASISTVNLAEALSTLATRGRDPADVVSELTGRGLLDGAVTVEPFTSADATEAARLRPLTRSAGLSLADRACLAVARRLSAGVLTADQAWSGVKLDIDVHTIRQTAQ